MTKKTKSARVDNDFLFLVAVSVFAVLTIFAASYINTANHRAIQTGQQPAIFDLAPLNPVQR